MIKNSLDRFEALAKQLVEGLFPRVLGQRFDSLALATEIVAALEREQRDGIAPDRIRIHLVESDYSHLRHIWPGTRQRLAAHVQTLAAEMGIALAGGPDILLGRLPDNSPVSLLVEASHTHPPAEEYTRPFQPLHEYDPLPALQRQDAFLIVAGKAHVLLDRPIVTIGRRSDCDIVLADRQVSRRHAQVRWRFDRFILTDLGSRGGTFVNNIWVEECVLRPNDVIRLGETTLLYAEGVLDDAPRPRHSPEGMTTALMPAIPDADP